ncbi:Protein of unknown function [Cotesia congregata]|uniref:Uncharacterized protein n=1 Tax=Cotesia congregata TaxID=51543 RepID=A0A8J2H8F0_COTCN|nr:Protein of unknown function [Cotesia congregata]
MDFEAINKVNHLEDFLPTKKLTDLTVNNEYRISELKIVNTKFGPRIIAIIDDLYVVFLPARTAKLLKDPEDIKKFNVAALKKELFLLYLGGQFNNFEFLRKNLN